MFIKRAKSRPSLRAREVEDEPSSSTGSPLAKSVVSADTPESDVSMSMDNDDDFGTGGSVMERKKARNKEKKGLSKGVRLSFGGGEAEEGGATPFKPKKSLLSQSIKLPSTPSSTSDIQPAASSSSIYSQDYLSQLKASTPSRAPKVEDQDGEQEDENGTGLSKVAQAKYGSILVEDSTAGIPDAVAVASAKAKRLAAAQMKKRGLDGEDYIALGDGQVAVWEGDKGPHPESRLMREEDEGEDGDEGWSEQS
jgi:GC-rich sequence DNA-binding factor